jgi:hypothetical protein
MKSKSKSKMSKLYSFEEKLDDLGLEYYIQLTILQNEGRDMWYMDDTISTINLLTKEQTFDLKRKIHKYFPELKIKFNEKNFSGGFTVYKKDIDWNKVDEKKYGELLGYICPVNNLGEMVKKSENKFGGSVSVRMKDKSNINIFGEWCFVENPDSVKQKYEERIHKITLALQKDHELWKLIDKVEGGTSGPAFHNSTYYIKKLRTLEYLSKSEKSDILGNYIGSYAAIQLQDYKYQWQNPKHREILIEIITELESLRPLEQYEGDNDEQTIENMKVWEAPYIKRLDDSWSFWYIF